MDTAQWPQGIGVVEHMEASRPMVERRARPQKDQALNCPRYWTEGGSLRNVPVGGGSRKNKRSSSKKLGDLTPPGLPHSTSQNPKIHEGQDLNLAYPPPAEDYNSLSKFVEVSFNTGNNSNHQNPSSSSTSGHLNAMELLKTGINSRGMSSFMSMPLSDSDTVYSSGFAVQDFKPTLNFPLDGFQTGRVNLQGVQESGARLLFPMEELKQVPSTTKELEQNRGQGESTGYWNGMLSRGHW
ncbi:dof zinc finger protein DOF4.6-like isoform X2 [Durio zibethinus]|uniref:Dof zinc finger protein DOF4.6-like isoform X2 n=1 Tax=Durio zibethinus TaxID=66656 RepID=A0A6P6AF62_DURZI|nr:dof zinc finger protein DOF4.6-like isoform X2 [Durio zibethinus]